MKILILITLFLTSNAVAYNYENEKTNYQKKDKTNYQKKDKDKYEKERSKNSVENNCYKEKLRVKLHKIRLLEENQKLNNKNKEYKNKVIYLSNNLEELKRENQYLNDKINSSPEENSYYPRIKLFKKLIIKHNGAEIEIKIPKNTKIPKTIIFDGKEYLSNEY